LHSGGTIPDVLALEIEPLVERNWSTDRELTSMVWLK
jgi:hypothetical protein